jgi:hypothetical protein
MSELDFLNLCISIGVLIRVWVTGKRIDNLIDKIK